MEAFSLLQIAPLSAILSAWYFSKCWENHALPAQPQISAVFLLLLSSLLCYLIGYSIQKWDFVEVLFSRSRSCGESSVLHGDDEEDRNSLEEARPNRPGRWSMIALVFAIASRIQLFHFVYSQQQCSSVGYGYWIWPGLVVFQFLSARHTLKDVKYTESDDPWRSELDDWLTWLEGDRTRHLNHFIISVVFACVAGFTANQFPASSYMCLPTVDNPSLVFSSQWVMVMLDTFIAIVFWQQIVWGKSAGERVQIVSKLLALSGASVFLIDTLKSFWSSTDLPSSDVPLLSPFAIFKDSITMAILLISTSMWIYDTNLTGPVGTLSVLTGLWQAIVNAHRYGEWDYLSKLAVVLPLLVILAATVAFPYAQRLKTVAAIPREVFNWIVCLAALITAVQAIILPPPLYNERHPISQLISESHEISRRWLFKGAASKSAGTGIRIYEDRHNDRKPPPQFKLWYEQVRDAKIRDNFPQIDEDLQPFWSLTPKQLRDAVEEASKLPDVGTLVIKDGQASIGRKDAGASGSDDPLSKLVQMASSFSANLPDMVLPINLARTPRVLPRWENRRTFSRASEEDAAADVISGRSSRHAEMSAAHETPGDQPSGVEGRGTPGPGNKKSMTTGEFRAMLRQACPANSASRANPYWNRAGFCRRCAGRHSTQQLMSDWHASLDSVCSQPDLENLHGFYMTAPDVRPVQKLLPLFSLYKTAHFADILLPLSPEDDESRAEAENHVPTTPFLDRSDNITWSGSIGQNPITPEHLHGHHKLRLLGQLTRARPADETTLIKPIEGETDEDPPLWVYTKRATADVNRILPLDVGISDYTSCTGHGCDAAKRLFGDDGHRQAASDASAQPQVDSKLVLLLDDDDGPAPGTLRALRTETTPIISTIFKTWYTSRIRPWVHFVPLDVRYQALHTTLSYFSVLEDRDGTDGYYSKAIAEEGKAWAGEAFRYKDQEIYLSRLLMEWARLVNDKRDTMGMGSAAPPVKHNP